MKIAYLGPRTYSEEAAKLFAERIRGDIELVPLPSLEDVALSLAEGEADLAVMACYNLLAGEVPNCLDLIHEHRLCVMAVQRLPIVMSIGAYPASTDYRKIYSHSMALAQCSDYLAENFPGSEQVEVASTSEGAAIVSKTKSGLAIAHTGALTESGLEIIATDISNSSGRGKNFTDFYLVSRDVPQTKIL
jgi:prephenate dehydratase